MRNKSKSDCKHFLNCRISYEKKICEIFLFFTISITFNPVSSFGATSDLTQPYIYTPTEADLNNTEERFIDFHTDIKIMLDGNVVFTEYIGKAWTNGNSEYEVTSKGNMLLFQGFDWHEIGRASCRERV